ncbi:hypothetical protein, partial [Pseudomonas aeruginosa]|uniref:hypothetical protein n=1 Tax=Pseudomonas aeruginosa TaxID=287 RepID=UPI003CC58990
SVGDSRGIEAADLVVALVLLRGGMDRFDAGVDGLWVRVVGVVGVWVWDVGVVGFGVVSL